MAVLIIFHGSFKHEKSCAKQAPRLASQISFLERKFGNTRPHVEGSAGNIQLIQFADIFAEFSRRSLCVCGFTVDVSKLAPVFIAVYG